MKIRMPTIRMLLAGLSLGAVVLAGGCRSCHKSCCCPVVVQSAPVMRPCCPAPCCPPGPAVVAPVPVAAPAYAQPPLGVSYSPALTPAPCPNGNCVSGR